MKLLIDYQTEIKIWKLLPTILHHSLKTVITVLYHETYQRNLSIQSLLLVLQVLQYHPTRILRVNHQPGSGPELARADCRETLHCLSKDRACSLQRQCLVLGKAGLEASFFLWEWQKVRVWVAQFLMGVASIEGYSEDFWIQMKDDQTVISSHHKNCNVFPWIGTYCGFCVQKYFQSTIETK